MALKKSRSFGQFTRPIHRAWERSSAALIANSPVPTKGGQGHGQIDGSHDLPGGP